MYEFDHMMNGKGSRQHLENAIHEAQYDKFAREVENTNKPRPNPIVPLRAVLASIISLFVR